MDQNELESTLLDWSERLNSIASEMRGVIGEEGIDEAMSEEIDRVAHAVEIAANQAQELGDPLL